MDVTLFESNTWHRLCIESWCTAPSAEQHNGVGKRRRRPRRVITSCHTVIVFDEDDCVMHIWLKVTSSCGGESSWHCLQPMSNRSQGSHHYHIPHRRPASPQTGGRGCGQTLVEANQGWSRRRREGITPHLISCWCWSCCHPCHQSRPPPLALIKVDIIIIANTHNVSTLFIWSEKFLRQMVFMTL